MGEKNECSENVPSDLEFLGGVISFKVAISATPPPYYNSL